MKERVTRLLNPMATDLRMKELTLPSELSLPMEISTHRQKKPNLTSAARTAEAGAAATAAVAVAMTAVTATAFSPTAAARVTPLLIMAAQCLTRKVRESQLILWRFIRRMRCSALI